MKNIMVYSHTNCRRRLLDSKKIIAYFTENGHTIVNDPHHADLIILVTCAFRDEIADSCLEKIKEFQHYPSELIIAGCLPDIETQKLSTIFQGKTLSTKNLHNIDTLFPDHTIKFYTIADSDLLYEDQQILNYGSTPESTTIPLFKNTYHHLKTHIIKHLISPHLLLYLYPLQKTNYHIRISWGCLGHCSYCAIKKALEPFHSKPLTDCIQELHTGLHHGYKNIIITADDVGAYGTDINTTFTTLLDTMTTQPGDYNISVQDLDPKWIVRYIDDFKPILARHKISSINVALQSGCHRTLKHMNRYANTTKIQDALLHIKQNDPHLSLDTHFILGFPTETSTDFMETMTFITDIDFDMGFIYRFSPRTNTPAEKMTPQLPPTEIISRIKNARIILKHHGYQVLTLSKNSYYAFYKKKLPKTIPLPPHSIMDVK